MPEEIPRAGSTEQVFTPGPCAAMATSRVGRGRRYDRASGSAAHRRSGRDARAREVVPVTANASGAHRVTVRRTDLDGRSDCAARSASGHVNATGEDHETTIPNVVVVCGGALAGATA